MPQSAIIPSGFAKVLLAALLVACQGSAPHQVQEDLPAPGKAIKQATNEEKAVASFVVEGSTESCKSWEAYTWLQGHKPEGGCLPGRFPAPQGYTRTPVASGGFEAWLRYLPLKPAQTPSEAPQWQ